jgi:predicted  nucleic acid-binding Zn-ribbon protein
MIEQTLVERLREWADPNLDGIDTDDIALEAADEIERLQAELSEWREHCKTLEKQAGAVSWAAEEIDRLKMHVAKVDATNKHLRQELAIRPER